MKNLSFTKNLSLQNILFDEYFSNFCNITIVAYNYDGNGNALCECDGAITELEADTVKKIIFGAPKISVENYLKSIFDPDSLADFKGTTEGHLKFNLPELKKLKKYDVLNLAKTTLKTFSAYSDDTLHYYTRTEKPASAAACQTCSTALYANTKSKVFHKTDCKSFNSITCTSLFNSHSEAVSAGFKPCRICKP
nr:hypothetical protein [Desulfobulbaceae bacterium]